MKSMTRKTEPIIFDNIEYEWKTLGGIFRLYPKALTEWPKLDVSSYQPKKREAKREAKHAEQASLFPAKYGD